MGWFEDTFVKPVKKAVSDVSNAVNNIGQQAADAVSSVTEGIRNDGGDIGKLVDAASKPAGSVVDGTRSILSGQVDQGLKTYFGGYLNSNPINLAINSSSSVQQLAQNDTFNNLTLGLSKDAYRATMAANDITAGTDTNQSYSDLFRYQARGLTYATGAAYLNGAGYIDKAAAYAQDKPLTAALAIDKIGQGKFGSAVDSVTGNTGLGKAFLDPAKQPPGRAPAGSQNMADMGPDYYAVPQAGLDDTNKKILIGVAVVSILAIVFKSKIRGLIR